LYWKAGLGPNLTKLCLIDTLAERHKIIEVLRSSPSLHTLSVSNTGEKAYIQKQIFLSKLRFLSLGFGDWPALHTPFPLLGLISPGELPLTVQVPLPHKSQEVSEMHAFFGRSNVSFLHAKPYKPSIWFRALQSSLFHMRTLVLECCDLNDPDLLDFLGLKLQNGAPWPELHTLRLSGCTIHLSVLKGLLGMHSIRELRLTNCQGDAEEEWTQQLSMSVPNTRCFIETSSL
jgi:hypothetical protein